MPSTALVAGGVRVEAGTVEKTEQGELQVAFDGRFAAAPVVVVTPHHVHGITAATHVETLVRISERGFVVRSNNRGPNLQLHWVAVGPAPAA